MHYIQLDIHLSKGREDRGKERAREKNEREVKALVESILHEYRLTSSSIRKTKAKNIREIRKNVSRDSFNFIHHLIKPKLNIRETFFRISRIFLALVFRIELDVNR